MVDEAPVLKTILDRVSAYYGIKIDDIKSSSRYTPIKNARHMFCYLAYHLYYQRYTVQAMGDVIDKTHCTILYGHTQIANCETAKDNQSVKIWEDKDILLCCL